MPNGIGDRMYPIMEAVRILNDLLSGDIGKWKYYVPLRSDSVPVVRKWQIVPLTTTTYTLLVEIDYERKTT